MNSKFKQIATGFILLGQLHNSYTSQSFIFSSKIISYESSYSLSSALTLRPLGFLRSATFKTLTFSKLLNRITRSERVIFEKRVRFNIQEDLEGVSWLESREQKRWELLKELELAWTQQLQESHTPSNLQNSIERLITIRRYWHSDNDIPFTLDDLKSGILQQHPNFILEELIANAFDAHVANHQEGDIQLRIIQEKDSIIFEVSDQGIGIEKTRRDQFGILRFDSKKPVSHPNNNKRQGGKYMAIHWIDILVQLHGGTIEAISPGVENFKTTVRCKLPIHSLNIAIKNTPSAVTRFSRTLKWLEWHSTFWSRLTTRSKPSDYLTFERLMESGLLPNWAVGSSTHIRSLIDRIRQQTILEDKQQIQNLLEARWKIFKGTSLDTKWKGEPLFVWLQLFEAIFGKPENTSMAIFSGGSGSKTLLHGLVQLGQTPTVLVNPFDDGKSTGMMRRVLGIVAVGDVFRVLLNLLDLRHPQHYALHRFLNKRTPSPINLLDVLGYIVDPSSQGSPWKSEWETLTQHLPEDKSDLIRSLIQTGCNDLIYRLELDGSDIALRNLLFHGAYLLHDRDYVQTLRFFRELSGERSKAILSSTDMGWLVALKKDGALIPSEYQLSQQAAVHDLAGVWILREPWTNPIEFTQLTSLKEKINFLNLTSLSTTTTDEALGAIQQASALIFSPTTPGTRLATFNSPQLIEEARKAAKAGKPVIAIANLTSEKGNASTIGNTLKTTDQLLAINYVLVNNHSAIDFETAQHLPYDPKHPVFREKEIILRHLESEVPGVHDSEITARLVYQLTRLHELGFKRQNGKLVRSKKMAETYEHQHFAEQTHPDRMVTGVSGNRAKLRQDESDLYGFDYIKSFGLLSYFYAQERLETFPTTNPLKIVIARDTRKAGRTVRDSIVKGLLAAAKEQKRTIEIVDLGVLPKPLAQLAIRIAKAQGGCYITASHNAPSFNGLEFSSGVLEPGEETSGGALMGAGGIQKVLAPFRSLRAHAADYFKIKSLWQLQPVPEEILAIQLKEETLSAYDQFLKETFNLHLARLEKLKGTKVLLKVNGGAAIGYAKEQLESLGMLVEEVGSQAGVFENNRIEPEKEDFENLSALLKEKQFDLGIIFDADADRGYTVFNPDILPGGTLPPQESTAFNLAMFLALQESKETITSDQPIEIIMNQPSSYVMEEIVARYNQLLGRESYVIRRVEVGEANVVAAMQKTGSLFGAEASNGGMVINATCRDGVTAAILAALALKDPKLGHLFLQTQNPSHSLTNTPPPLASIIDALPKRARIDGKVKGSKNPTTDIFPMMETLFQKVWETAGWLQETYDSYEVEYANGVHQTQYIQNGNPLTDRPEILQGTGWALILTRKDDPTKKEFIWIRQSNTEPGTLRYQVETLLTEIESPLITLFNSLFSEACPDFSPQPVQVRPPAMLLHAA